MPDTPGERAEFRKRIGRWNNRIADAAQHHGITERQAARLYNLELLQDIVDTTRALVVITNGTIGNGLQDMSDELVGRALTGHTDDWRGRP